MAYSGSGGTKGLGQITSPYTPRADLNKILELLGNVGNRRVVTTTERDDLTGAKVYEGLEIFNTTTKQIEIYNGSGWARVLRLAAQYTPVWANFTPGPSVVDTLYQVVGRFCEGTVDVTLVAGWSMGSGVTMTLPVTASAPALGRPIGEAIYVSAGVGTYKGRLMMSASGTAQLMWEPNQTFLSDVKAAEPFTWKNGDKISLQFKYAVS